MCDVMIPARDGPVKIAVDSSAADPAALLALHREVLETIRLTIASCAHPGCAACHELASVLDRYLLA